MSNITTAVFTDGNSTTTEPLYQYDYGQLLAVVGVTVPDACEVHFSNGKSTGTAFTSIYRNGAVSIPDELLTTGRNVYAWFFIHTGTNDGRTMYEVKIPVNARAEAEDVEPTPVEQSALTEIIAAYQERVEELDTKIAMLDVAIEEVYPYESDEGVMLNATDTADAPIRQLKLYGTASQSTTPTPIAPVEVVIPGSGGTLNIVSAGKNLLGAGQMSKSSTGIETLEVEPYTGKIHVYSPASNTRTYEGTGSKSVMLLPAGKTYTVSMNIESITSSTGVLRVGFRSYSTNIFVGTGRDISATGAWTGTFTIPAGEPVYFSLLGSRDVAQEFDFTISGLQIELGSTATDFVPYDGTAAALTLTNGMPGIPVSSGGNYTDASGQQWICDEVDLERGVYVQRVGVGTYTAANFITTSGFIAINVADAAKATSSATCGQVVSNMYTGATTWNYASAEDNSIALAASVNALYIKDTAHNVDAATASAFLAENPLTVVYPLATPIVTDLTTAQKEALAGLRSRRHETHVWGNDRAKVNMYGEITVNLSHFLSSSVTMDGNTMVLNSTHL